MKLFHTSDWHLGRMLYGRSLLDDQRYFLEQVFLPAVEREKPDCVILSGDLYDRQIAPPEAIRLLDGIFSRLAELGCTVAAISGNHDGADRIAIMKGALRRCGVYLSTSLSDALTPVELEADGEHVQLFLLPYFDCAAAREFFSDEGLRGEAACMQRMLQELERRFRPGCTHILAAHCFAAGAFTSDSESTLFVGGSGEVPPALFSAFDYVALGHLHGPQKAGENGRYSGSPLKYSIDEERQKKSFLLLELKGGAVTETAFPVVPLHDVRRISGGFEELLEAGAASPCEDYVELNLTDEAPVMLAAQRLRPYYPNLLAVTNNWAAATAIGGRAEKLKGQDETTVFRTFLEELCGTEATEEDLSLFSEILEEAEAKSL